MSGNKNILVWGPCLSLSGYGRQTRFLLRALKKHTNHNLFVNPTEWGQTAWISEESRERRWIDNRIEETQKYIQASGGQPEFDASIQVTIPNELDQFAPINICYTAGIETTQISPQWAQKCNEIADKVLVVSDFSKEIFEETSHDLRNQQGQIVRPNFQCQKPVRTCEFPFIEADDPVDLDLGLKHEFNFLTVAQWGPRKNVDSLIRWFVEEFYDEKVGLIAKLNQSNNSLLDYRRIKRNLDEILDEYPDRKCAVHLLHGELSKNEMLSLYQQNEVRAYLSTTHGECFGLPIFEAACAGVPVVATDWSGHPTYLEQDDEKLFQDVKYQLSEIPDDAVWEGVLMDGSEWAYPKQGDFKYKSREVYEDYPKFVAKANKLRKKLKEQFDPEKKEKEIVDEIHDTTGFVSDGEGYVLEDLAEDPAPPPRDFQTASFCITTHGKRKEKLELEIESVHQTMEDVDKEYEIVIAGDVEEFEGRDDVRTVDAAETAHDGMLAKLRNIVKDAAEGDIYILADDDIIFDKKFGERLAEYTRKNGWEVLGTKILLPDGGRYWDRATHTPHRMVGYDEDAPNLYQTGCFMIMRSGVFEECKWDGDIPYYAEEKEEFNENDDVEYSKRLQDNGYSLMFDKDNLVWHYDDSYMEWRMQDGTLLCLDKETVEEEFGIDTSVMTEREDRFENLIESLAEEVEDE